MGIRYKDFWSIVFLINDDTQEDLEIGRGKMKTDRIVSLYL